MSVEYSDTYVAERQRYLADTPADIREAVHYLWRELNRARVEKRPSLPVFAKYLLAERERCAKIADSMPGWKQPRDVAAAIRTPQTTPQVTPQTSGGAA